MMNSNRIFNRLIIVVIVSIISACTSSKNNFDGSPKSSKNYFLPVHISYSGTPVDDSIKTFISHYLESRNIKIITSEEVQVMCAAEIRRAGSSAKSQTDFLEAVKKNQRYVCNMLSIQFDLTGDNKNIILGWRSISFPMSSTAHPSLKFIYLKNYQITSDPPQPALRALCDSIISSRTLN